MTVHENERLIRPEAAQVDRAATAEVRGRLRFGERRRLHRQALPEKLLKVRSARIGNRLTVKGHIGQRVITRPRQVHVERFASQHLELVEHDDPVLTHPAAGFSLRAAARFRLRRP